MDFISDELDEFVDTIRDELSGCDEAVYRRQKRMEDCRKYTMSGINPENGMIYHKTWYCDSPLCEHCMAKRGEKYRNRVEKAILTVGNIYMLHTAEETILNKINAMGKPNYIVFPQDETTPNSIIVYRSTAPFAGSIPLNEQNIDDQDWKAIARKRPGRRTSGMLGCSSNPENTGKIKIKIKELRTPKSNFSEVEKIMRTVTAETPYVQTEDRTEAEQQVNAIVDATVDACKAAGIECSTVYKTWHVRLSCNYPNGVLHDNPGNSQPKQPELMAKQLSFTS